MKKRFLMIAGVIVAFMAASVIVASVLPNDDFLDENVEALLSSESVSGVIECDGTGNLYCPLTHTNEFREVTLYQ